LINYINWINSTPPKIFKDDLDPTDQEIKKSITEFEGGINKTTEHMDKIGLPQGLP
jgi:truncated hemoglobin YjbI